MESSKRVERGRGFEPERVIPRLEEALHQCFGLAAFRPGQREVIELVLRGRDAITVMPTGSGKSLCYQLPAMIMPGLTLVVSPLIALMKDQVDGLRERGLPATFINSTLSPGEQRERMLAAVGGGVKLLFVAPERFRAGGFMEMMRRADISLFAIDEAHCISQWGHDFRPDYLKLGEVRGALGSPPTLALTATATPFVRHDIIAQLGLADPAVMASGFERPNLFFQVAHAPNRKAKLAATMALASQARGAGIVYCSTRKRVEELAPQLTGAGLRVGIYHAGLRDPEREMVQNRFMEGAVDCLVATNAFGMGVDKSDLRYVVHYNLPGSLEAYYQEAGRAGRDGQPAHCMLLYNYADTGIHEFFIKNSYPERWLIQSVYQLLARQGVQRLLPLGADDLKRWLGKKAHPMGINSALRLLRNAGHVEKVKQPPGLIVLDRVDPRRLRVDFAGVERLASVERERLKRVVFYATSKRCRTRDILDYFGSRELSGDCGHCDSCRSSTLGMAVQDAARTQSGASARARQAQAPARALRCEEPPRTVIVKILSCVARLKGRHDLRRVAGVLYGSTSKAIRAARLEKATTYGLLSYLKRKEISYLVDLCYQADLVGLNDAHRAILTEAGKRVMTDREAPLPERLGRELVKLFPTPPRSIQPWRPPGPGG